MTKLKAIADIRKSLMQLRRAKDRLSDDDTAANEFQREREMLLEWFYRENSEMLAPQQYVAAQKDFEYFVRLVELAYYFYVASEPEEKESVH